MADLFHARSWNKKFGSATRPMLIYIAIDAGNFSFPRLGPAERYILSAVACQERGRGSQPCSSSRSRRPVFTARGGREDRRRGLAAANLTPWTAIRTPPSAAGKSWTASVLIVILLVAAWMAAVVVVPSTAIRIRTSTIAWSSLWSSPPAWIPVYRYRWYRIGSEGKRSATRTPTLLATLLLVTVGTDGSCDYYFFLCNRY